MGVRTSDLSPSVTAELIRLLYRHVPSALAANLVNCSLMLAVLWRQADPVALWGWAAAVVAVSLSRINLWQRCRHCLSHENARRWRFRYTLGSTLSGCVWGSTALLFVRPDDPTSLILVSFVIGGMAAGAVTTLSAHLPAFILYVVASVLPLNLRLVSLGEATSLAMAGMATVYVVGLFIVGRSFNAALIRSLVLNEENTRLLATREQEVRMRTADLRAANAELEREIGERKAVEARLEEARAEAERANEAKSRFLAAASHDLRQPLQSMFLFASALHRHVSGRAGIEALTRIERGLDMLKALLDSLLDLSRLDANVMQPEIAAVPLRPVFEDIIAAFGRIAASKGIQLKCEVLADTTVRSDQLLLGRMLRNLVENALRYTDRGSIILSSHDEGTTLRIDVMDTGIGIAPEQLERIFDEFHQVGNPERDKAQGLGLGLAIVQRLSRILDHPVEVRSQPGVGSTFSIRLPKATGAPAEPVPCKAEEPAASGVGRRMMVIDDDPMVLLALNTIFEQWGYGVTMAGSKEEALGLLQPQGPPHLIVADYRLRNGRIGTDAIRSIRAACGTQIPSIVLTGETGRECENEAETVGALVLHKPVTPHDLAFALKRLSVTVHAEGLGAGPH